MVIFEQIASNCQLKRVAPLLLLVLLLASCGSEKILKDENQIIKTHIYRPLWFKVSEQFSFKDDHEQIIFHPFFDLLPSLNVQEKLINYVPLTEKDSPYSYSFDFLSGQKYMEHPFCPQVDIWKGYETEINRPPYERGFIPRVLDQRGHYQEIIVFGKETKKKSFEEISRLRKGDIPIEEAPKPFNQARVVGGVLEQFCDDYPCTGIKKWVSKIVLFGVIPSDPNFKDVYNIKKLKERIYYPQVKAFMENSKGHTIGKDQRFVPTYRILGEISPQEALKVSLEKGHVFSGKELMSLRNSCQSLYNYAWDMAVLIRGNQSINNQKNLDIKLKKYWAEKKYEKIPFYAKKYSLEEAKKNVLPFNVKAEKDLTNTFKDFFLYFIENYGEQFNTCTKYVRYSNVNEDYERHWYLTYLQAFFSLKSLDFVYDCKSEAWIKNPFNASRGENDYDFMTQIKKCNDRNFDEAFETSTRILTNLGYQHNPTFRYIPYDWGIGGNNKKMYSFVPQSGKILQCISGKKEYDEWDRKKQYFPTDISWQRFYIPKIIDRNIILIEDNKKNK